MLSYRPSWQLPPGVSRGAWDYVNDRSIATEYDDFHRGHPLLRLDEDFVAEHLLSKQFDPCLGPVLIDFGCGTGRSIEPWCRRGWRVIGVDLSIPMLQTAASRLIGNDDQVGLVRANLAQLDAFNDHIADSAVCLYSSIGMIRGHVHRQAFIQSVHRILKPNGTFIVHAHNRGNWFTFPRGWLMWTQSRWRSFTQRDYELGDRIYLYRGLPGMFLHIFSARELRRLLEGAGFVVRCFRYLNGSSSDYLPRENLLPTVRAGGFLVAAQATQKPS